jgi:hypothetical protein
LKIRDRCLQAILDGFEANRAFRDTNDSKVMIYPGSCGENAAVLGGVLFAAIQSGALKVGLPTV